MERVVWRYLGFFFSGLVWSILCIWVGLIFLLPLNLVLYDLFITRYVDWSLRSYRLPRRLQLSIEWIFVVLLALVCSFTIKLLFLETYKIPTPSMEETLLAGDYIFVSKLAYGPRLPETYLELITCQSADTE